MRSSIYAGLLGILLLASGCQPATPTAPSPTAQPAEGSADGTAPPLTPTATIESAISLLSRPTQTSTPLPPTATSTATPAPSPTFTPVPTIPPSVIEVEGATLPPGFSMFKFASVFRPTGMTVDETGRLFVTSQDGSVHIFEDADGDHHAEQDILFSSGFNIPLGIAISPDQTSVYISSNSKISVLEDIDGDSKADNVSDLTTGLPVGLHQNDNLKFGPDGMLYMGIGSTCNACTELDPRSGTIMRFDPETGDGEVIATGLRNPFDLAFHPTSGDLFATDNGRDDLGMDSPFEELNLIQEGRDYGWPDCWNDGQGNGCDGTETAVAFFEPHSSANSLDFYTVNDFPEAYRSSGEAAIAYVTVFGSWLKPDAQTGIARVRLTPAADSYQSDVSWFAQWPGAMPLGLVVSSEGVIFVGDYINDIVYRISYGN